MRNLKRVLSLALSLVMVLGLLVITSSAASTTTTDFKDADEITNVEAVEVLSALKVLEGDDNNNFNPTQILTRETAAKIICYMLIGPDNADKLGGSSVFSDVAADRWSAGYIAYCTNLGILAGAGDGTFNPEGELTGVAFAKMLLVALGYDPDIEGYVGANWAIAVASGAIDAGIDADLNLSLPLAREDAAQMAFQTLTADLVKYTGGVNVATSDGTNVTVDATRYDAETPAYSYQSTGAAETATAGAQFCEKYFPTLKLAVNGASLKDDFGYAVRKWYIGSSKTDYAVTDAKTVATVTAAKVLATYDAGIAKVTQGDLYKIAGGAASLDIYENGTDSSSDATVARGVTDKVLTSYKGAKAEVVDNDNDGVADAILVTYAYLAKVTAVTDATATADRKVTLTVYNTYSGTETVYYTTDDFAKGDYVLVYPKGKMAGTDDFTASSFNTDGNILAVEAAQSIEGTITGVTGANGTSVTALTVDGTSYTVGVDALATLGITAGAKKVSDTTYGFTTSYTLFVNNGFVIGVLGEAAVKNIADYVYVVATSGTGYDAYGKATYPTQIVRMDGTTEVVNAHSSTTAGLYKIAYDSSDGDYTFTGATDTTSKDINTTDDFYGKNQIDGEVAMTAKTTSVTVDTINSTSATKAYITSSTRLLFVDGKGATLKVSLATGAMKQSIGDDSLVLLSKTSTGNYEVEAIIIAAAQVSVSSDMVYAKTAAVGTVYINGTEYNQYEIYSLTTGEKTTVAATGAPASAGIATYSVNADGAYTFGTALAAVTSADNADGMYVAANGYLTVYNNLLSCNDSSSARDFSDLDASGAVIVNATGSTANDGLTLTKLASASSLAAQILVQDGVVVAVVVTTYSA
jgi:hypothetical protein